MAPETRREGIGTVGGCLGLAGCLSSPKNSWAASFTRPFTLLARLLLARFAVARNRIVMLPVDIRYRTLKLYSAGHKKRLRGFMTQGIPVTRRSSPVDTRSVSVYNRNRQTLYACLTTSGDEPMAPWPSVAVVSDLSSVWPWPRSSLSCGSVFTRDTGPDFVPGH